VSQNCAFDRIVRLGQLQALFFGTAIDFPPHFPTGVRRQFPFDRCVEETFRGMPGTLSQAADRATYLMAVDGALGARRQ
jgi:hypothetical protein